MKKNKTQVKLKNDTVVSFDDDDSKDPIYGFSNLPFYDPDDYSELGQLLPYKDEEE